jgi:large repetitive protein
MRITISLVLVFFTATLFAQQISSRFTARDRGWVTFGIDGGWAYQSSDVRTTFNGWGAGLTLGKNVFYRPGGLLSFDIRGRMLFTRAYGSDWRPTYDIAQNDAVNGNYHPGINYLIDKSSPLDSSFIFANHRTGMGEIDAEGVITFNRLRERTGIVFNLFGGIGLNAYRVRTDQGNNNRNAYNYLSINTSNGQQNTLDQLASLRDGVYESRAEGSTSAGLRLGIMPDAGIELGYQLTRHFVFGVGHKTTFSRTDILDGQRSSSSVPSNDWAHYTNIFLRWDLARNTDRARKPEIDITSPDNNPYISQSSSVFVKANIKNINSPADVRCYLNGESRGFEFRNGRFGSSVRLRPGRNEMVIEASNMAGSDEEILVIVWEEVRDNRNPMPPPPPPSTGRQPVVRITSPSYSPFKTDKPDIYLRAEVQNIRDKRDLRLLVNGVEETRFTLAEGLEASLRLREGRNVVRIEANTPAGSASDEVVIEVANNTPPPPPPPSSGRRPNVNITKPSSATATTTEKNYDFRATVTNVSSRDEITLLVNNREVRDFTYTPKDGSLSSNIDLQPNDNEVVVRAKNSAGTAEDKATISRNGGIINPPPARKPSVSITQPTNNASFDRKDIDFSASTTQVNAKSEIIVVFNGANVSIFDFDKNTQTISGKLNLRDGENTLTVKVVTTGGNAESTVRFKYAAIIIKPTVDIVSPANGSEVRIADTELRATVRNVTSKSDIQVYANGKSIAAFDYNSRSGQVSAKIPLDKGENTIRVTASNNGGTAEGTVRLKYTASTPKPIVDIDSPANGSEIRTADTELRANVQNVSTKNDILIYVNGKTVPVFDYDNKTGRVTAKIQLGEGENTVRVSASNSGGTGEQSYKVRYTPQRKPTVTISSPADRSRVDNPAVTLTAKVTNVFSDKNVVVKLNSTEITGFTIGRGGTISIPLTLREGDNTISVTATTPDGTDNANVTVVYAAKVEKPTVVFINPGLVKTRSGTNTKASYEVKAKVTGISGVSDLKVYHNGLPIRKLDYSIKTKEVTYTVTLKDGKNTFKIIAENTAGSAQAEADITYKANTGPVPTVDITSTSEATTDPFNPNTSKTSVIATLKNVTDKAQITFTVDGTNISNFEFTPSTGIFKGIAPLKKGANVIVVKAVSDAGEAQDSVTVRF